MSGGQLLIYGANGYTGRLVIREALEKGLRPILSGRNAVELDALGAEHGLQVRVAALDDDRALDGVLAGCGVVIHCAGPFSRTARPMAEACMRTGTHYLDITGEISVFEGMAALSKEAAAKGVMLMPGAGFDVVPSDCLAAFLKEQLPTATTLTLAFVGGSGLSRGTATTMTENIAEGGAVRRGGKIVRVPSAWRERDIDFGDKVRHTVTIPWGDVSTAWHSTRIPDIEVYTGVPRSTARAMKMTRYLGWLLATAPVQRWLKARIRSGAPGPSDAQRSTAQSRLWGEVRDAEGRVVQARLLAPDGYTLTARTAVAAAQKVLAGTFKPGFQTPSRAFGSGFILEIPGCTREIVPVVERSA
ncbi:MAG: saccharopine dehydrogenase NADP-binding domain-containing protein [Gemmatimonadetes bacterium]|nr:saccharopine dehydrogenase NADP-binding domain-containing protein [Gemmatimonadota bacterium]MBI3569005.1 saccharopine dehydrogenase NADP-binding domain-containing protein [Gemmatimonadota bacterium]